MFCPQCGSERPLDMDHFCASCGESLERTGPAGSRWAPEPAVEARLSPVDARIHLSPYIASKLNPFGGDVTDYVVPLRDPAITRATDGLPLPPIELWEGYAETPAEYLADGRRDTEKMLGALHDAGASAQTLTTVLDFGCAAGRMLRHYPRIPDKTELWGVDINAKHIAWCQQNLSPPVRFATTTTAPHLPFEDHYFDLVYCASVFTHISDLADAWLLEVHRVLRAGGYAYVTIHDEHTLELLFTKYKDHPLFRYFIDMVQAFVRNADVRSKTYAYFSIQTDPVSQVFYNREYLLKKWSLIMEIVSVIPEGHDHQTTIILRKRNRTSGTKISMPKLRKSYSDRFVRLFHRALDRKWSL